MVDKKKKGPINDKYRFLLLRCVFICNNSNDYNNLTKR